MAEKRLYAFASPELHWLNNPLGSSYALKRDTLLHELLNKTANDDKGNPNGRGSSNGKGISIGRELFRGIVGAALGIAAATATAPIERVHILMQCQNEMIRTGRLSTPYKGMKDCLIRTVKNEGLGSLWRGNSLHVISFCLKQAYPFAMVSLPNWNYISSKIKESYMWMIPFAVVPAVTCFYPLGYARVRLACDVKPDVKSNLSLDSSRNNNIGNRQFNGVIDVYKKALRLDGIHGLYRGVSWSCIGLIANVMTTNSMTRKGKPNQEKKAMLPVMAISLFIVMFTLPIVFYPFITLSRRMMMTSGEATKYRGSVHAFNQIVRTEGVSSLFKGATPYMIHRIARDMAKLGLLNMSFLTLLNTPAK